MKEVWQLNLANYEASQNGHLLIMPESDEEWADMLESAEREGTDFLREQREYLDQVRARVLAVLPERFHPYIHNHTINTPALPKVVRDDYLAWCKGQDAAFHAVFERAAPAREQAMQALLPKAHDIFSESLHDTTIRTLKRANNSLEMMIDTAGGFTPKALVMLKFQHIFSEEGRIEAGHMYIYDELRLIDGRLGLRVVWENPLEQWTIVCEAIDADYYFRPIGYFERAEDMTFATYVEQLNPHMQYYFIGDECQQWQQEPLVERPDGIYLVDSKIANDWSECIEALYCDTYEDPYAIFSEPVPYDELEIAAHSDELTLQVRAFNTFYVEPEKTAGIVNRVLQTIRIHEQNELLALMVASHYATLGLLNQVTLERWPQS